MDDISAIRRNAESRRDAARAEAARWDHFLRMLDEVSGVAGYTPGIDVEAMLSVPKADGPKRRAVKGEQTEVVAKAYIQERGRPVPTRELLLALQERGVEIGGKEPYSTLLARLSRVSSLEQRKPLGWVVKDAPIETDAAGASLAATPAASEVTPTSSPVEPSAGGGT